MYGTKKMAKLQVLQEQFMEYMICLEQYGKERRHM